MKARRERAPQLFLSDEYALFVGTVSDTSTHAHYAVQLTLTLGDSFEVRTDAGHEKCGAAIIPSREPHAVRASAGRLFMLYLDATAPLGGRVAASCKGRGVRTLGVEDVGRVDDRGRRAVGFVAGSQGAADTYLPLTYLADLDEDGDLDVVHNGFWVEQINLTTWASHTIDNMRSMLGDFAGVSATLPTTPAS